MQERKTYYLYVKGQKVEVSEEVYRAYVQPERKQRMREYRAQDKIQITSVEALAEKGIEVEDNSQDVLTSLIADEESAEELSRLRAAIAKLSERDRQIVQLYFFEGKTQQAIADILGIAQPTLYKILKRILSDIKKFF